MRIGVLMSITHSHLQPLLGLHSAVKDDVNFLSVRFISTPEPYISYRQMLTTGKHRDFHLEDRVQWLCQVLDAICALHERNLYACNISLDTVFIDEKRKVVLAPACIMSAKWRPEPGAQLDNLFVPPALRDKSTHSLTEPSKTIFAFGVLLWFLVRSDWSLEVTASAASELPRWESPQDVQELWDLFQDCCADDPKNRPSVEESRKRLAKVR